MVSLTLMPGWVIGRQSIQKKEMEKVGVKKLFAETEASGDTQLHTIMEVGSMEIVKQISTDPEIIERRRSAGFLVEIPKMIPLLEPRIDM